ncbi:hypothetical protein L6452_14954 [Arctium lappa]|uniref:Uncharacterized protein n=1 Tax=Arctium lappa TaxID=4217 RepID=A0ACB9CMJ4_ARCLA|nr:hypothetical protein L6452_14954 [Arctium lappa]
MRKSIFPTDYYGRHASSPSIYIHHLYAQQHTTTTTTTSLHNFHPISLIDKASDFVTLSVIAVILLLSLVSIFCIFHLHRKSRASLHLRSFNNLWAVRLLLVLFVSCWAVNEILRLDFIRQRFLFTFFPTLTFSKQDHLCKLQVVLSLGFLEPGFLVTLLYLINVSIKQQNPAKKGSVLMVIVMSLPPLILQIIFLFFTPLKEQLPWVMTRTSLFSVDGFGNNRMICTYPLLASILFCVFAIVYSMGLLVACWQVVSLVINKTIRIRINMLGLTVMMALLIQTTFLGAESLWMPEDIGFGGVSLGLFVSVAVCATVGEIVLVIKPIMEALETGRHCSGQLNHRLQQAADGGGGGRWSAKRPLPNAHSG